MKTNIVYNRNKYFVSFGLFAILSTSLFILMTVYFGLCPQKDIQHFLRIGWAGLVFIFLSLFFVSMYGSIYYSIHHLIRIIKKNGLSGGKKLDIHRRFFLSQTAQNCLVVFSAVSTGHAMANTPEFPMVKKQYVYIKDLSADLEGFRIAHISDIHADIYTTYKWMHTTVRMTNSLKPDLIAITGDLADAPVDRLTGIVSPLLNLSAPYGCYFVTGNHEYSMCAGGVESWISYLRHLGLDVLLNEHRLIKHGAGRILLGGVTDYSAGFDIPGHTSLPHATVKNAPAADIKILLAHQPKSIYQAAAAGFDIQLSGHTHGGQIFPGQIFMALMQPFVKGIHQYRNAQIYVNSGAGSWGPKMRLGSTPEIALIILSRRPTA